MNTAEWILVAILSLTLFVFLLCGIILLIKIIGLTKEAKKIIERGQHIAEKTDDIVENVKGMTSVGGVVKTFSERIMNNAKGEENGNSKKSSK